MADWGEKKIAKVWYIKVAGLVKRKKLAGAPVFVSFPKSA